MNVAMDARQLRYFLAVAELGGFSAAARHLGIAQPALSRHVKALEDQLGVPLLTRTVRGVRMTGQGETLFHHAQGILRQLEMVPQIVGERTATVSGRVVIGLPTSVSAVLARPLLRATMERLPQVRVHLIDSLSGFLEEWVEAGRLDVCVLYDAQPSASLRLEGILVEDLCLIGAAGAFAPERREIAFRRLADFPLVLPALPHSLRRLLEMMALSHGVRLNIVLEVDSLPVSKAIAEEGRAYAVLPQGAVHVEIQRGALEAIEIVEPRVSRSVSLATSAMRGSTRACNEVRRLTLEVARELRRTGVWKGMSLDRVQ